MKWGKKTLEITDGDWLTCRWNSNELTKFPIPCGDEYCNIPKLLFSAPCVACPVLEESLPAVVVLAEHPASLGPLLKESLLAVVVLNCWTVDVDGPYVEGVDRLDTSYKGRSVGRVSLWDASISDAIGTFSPCGTAVVWPFCLGMVFAFLTSNAFCWNPFFGGFRSLFGGFIFIWILDDVDFFFDFF